MMDKTREFYVPEICVYDCIDQCLAEFPDDAVSVLYDLSDMKSAYDKAVEALKWYAQKHSSFIVTDAMWERGLRVQTKAIETLKEIGEL